MSTLKPTANERKLILDHSMERVKLEIRVRELFEEVSRLTRANGEMEKALEAARIPHRGHTSIYDNEGGGYCPVGDPDRPDCDCGADKLNAAIDAALARARSAK